jgi:hypothetical protein
VSRIDQFGLQARLAHTLQYLTIACSSWQLDVRGALPPPRPPVAIFFDFTPRTPRLFLFAQFAEQEHRHGDKPFAHHGFRIKAGSASYFVLADA